ncbi:MAG TPA: hypothetical protein VKI01_13030 [Acidimicrobiia bacterium]|nr:hypothetical protein [Acidimicrobiia bacterium]
MALAILLGGFIGLLVAGGVLVVGTIRHARREEDEMNRAFAEVRGAAHNPADDTPSWSSIDMEALREEGYDVDHADPYATLTGEISWTESTLADGHAPLSNGEPEPVVVTERVEELDEPAYELDEPVTMAEPVVMPEPVVTPEPVATPEPVVMRDPVVMREPVVMPERVVMPEPVTVAQATSGRAAPAPVREQEPVVWRAPAQSQVIILAVSLRALADAVAATVTQEAWERFDEAYAQVRSRFQEREGARRPPSIDVDTHERRSWSGAERFAPRRRGPARPGGPKHISWRAR